MNEPVQIIPALTLLEDEGEITLRIGSQTWAATLGQELVKLVPSLGIGRKLILITPTDTKVFKFSAEKNDKKPPPPETFGRGHSEETAPKPASARIHQDFSAPMAPELVGEYEEELRRQANDEEQVRAQQKEMATEVAPIDTAEEEVATPRKRGRPSKAVQSLANAASCGRCGGGGALEGGGMCPVCQGAGAFVKYGRK